MPCPETHTRLEAFFDGELDALAAAGMERHTLDCDECRAELEELQKLRRSLRRDLGFDAASPELRHRVVAALDRESESTPLSARAAPRPAIRAPAFWRGMVAGMGAVALASGAVFFFAAPIQVNPLFNDLVNAHVRSLMPAHLIDVESTDRHTVKPWFAGHADVSPAVFDFSGAGYRLLGGRADYFDRQRAAVVVYQHGAHVINVFSWADERRSLPGDTTRSGWHLAFWRIGNLNYCAVSDTGWDELVRLQTLIREAAGDTRGSRPE
jgi:anti-sigma factor RsiW